MATKFLFGLAAAAVSVGAQANWTVGQTVLTSSGSVQGHASSQSPNVSEYLGIPFAQPPVGTLRFAAPLAVNATGEIINGTDFGFSCLGSQIYPVAANATGLTQQGREIYNEWNQVGDRFGEDCLTLNVWTKPQTGDAKKAVLVWLYGGGFFTGSTSVPLYNGRVFADEQDVVVVTVNYRLNMFGFPGSPATQQNLGLLDMRMAIEWVSQNIAQFGGDPDRVVLFGQSAGAVAADMLIYAFPQDTIVKGLILQSGNAAVFSGLGEMEAPGAAMLWFRTAASLGCTGDDATVLACMRSKPAMDLLNAQFPPAGGQAASMTPVGGFLPTIDNITVFSDYQTRTNFSKIPILIGNNDNEGGITQALALANAGIHVNTTTGSPATASAGPDTIFTCPNAQRANVAVANNLPVWRYRWFGSFPNTQLLANVDSGAWHGSELGVLFGTNQVVVANTPEENALGTVLRSMWAAFAKSPVHGLDGLLGGVPRYTATGDSLLRLGLNNTMGLNLAAGNAFDMDCPQVPAAQNTGTQGVSSGHRSAGLPSAVLEVVCLFTTAAIALLFS